MYLPDPLKIRRRHKDGFLHRPFFKPLSVKKKMNNIFTTKRLCRAGIIAALYVALTYAFGPLPYLGILQVRPAEALTILPLFYAEAVPALWIGCMLANLASPSLAFDVPLGGLATLVAALLTFFAGKLIKNHALKVGVGGFFPVIVNAFVIPFVIILGTGFEEFASYSAAYWTYFLSLAATQALWVYALGIPLYYTVYRLRAKGVSAFTDDRKQVQ